MTQRRIVIATTGSLGDLHPYMALALGLLSRGHNVAIATSTYYRQRIEAAGIAFAAMRPHPPLNERAVYARILDPKHGPEYTFRHLILGSIDATYEDLKVAAVDRRADLLISSPTVFAARPIAEKYRIPWASSVLAPLSMFSAYEPPVVRGVPAALSRGPASLRPAWGSMVLALARFQARTWTRSLTALRTRLQLPEREGDAIFSDHHAPDLSLAMFSPAFAGPQLDWPRQVVQTGFAFYDADAHASDALTPELSAFLNAGDPPIVFTLGSTAVHAAKTFYAESARAALMLGKRAILLAGDEPENRVGLPDPLPESIFICAYASYSRVFPRTAVIVHQGGIGTTAQALRAGLPSLVVPFTFDQPDNGARIMDLGVGMALSEHRYRAKPVAKLLGAILADRAMLARARKIGLEIAAENGVEQACDAIESMFARA